MVAIYFALLIGYFLLCFYLMLRFGSNYPKRYLLLFLVLLLVVIFIGDLFEKLSFLVVYFSVFFVPVFANLSSFFILRNRAGNRFLTYKRSKSNMVITTLAIVFILIMSYFISIPNVRTYPGGEPVYDDRYYHERLPISIAFGLLGLASISLIFRKGEFFEKGFATPDLQFYPWNGYSSYKWLEDSNKKNEERFSLLLQGEKGASHTVHGFSESTKNILDELLKRKFPNQAQSS